MQTKICKFCKESIAKNAKRCPKCGGNLGMPTWAKVLIIIGVVILLISGCVAGCTASLSDAVNEVEKDLNIESTTSETNVDTSNIEYTKVDIDDLEAALDSNAATAKDTYNGKYLEITGRLGTIDSDLKYISLLSTTDEWDIIGIHCTIKNSATKEVVKTLKKDQTIVVKGKITDVGEVLGYYLDIDEVTAK